MATYQKNTEDRKTIVHRIAEITGQKLRYTMPGYIFKGQGFTVAREGNLEADETADRSVIATLVEEGLILPTAEAQEATDFQDVAESATAAQEGENAEGEEPVEASEENAPAAEESAKDAPTEASKPENLTVSLPMSGHTGNSLRNLVYMVYARGKLLSKATGGNFSCTEALADALKSDSCILTTEALRDAVWAFETEHGTALTGISFTTDKVTFTFPMTDDPEKVQTFQQLACQMVRLAKEQKRTLAREVDGTNEKYIFRIWLIALGMAGSEFKAARRILLAPLFGSAAFKDQAMEDRWKAKQAAKRDAAKATANSHSPVTEEEETA